MSERYLLLDPIGYRIPLYLTVPPEPLEPQITVAARSVSGAPVIGSPGNRWDYRIQCHMVTSEYRRLQALQADLVAGGAVGSVLLYWLWDQRVAPTIDRPPVPDLPVESGEGWVAWYPVVQGTFDAQATMLGGFMGAPCYLVNLEFRESTRYEI